MKNTIKKIAYIAMGVILTGTIAIASVAMASTQQNSGTTANGQTTANGSFHKFNRGPGMGRPGMMGTPPALTGTRYQILGQITAISGTTLTVKDSNGTSFTVDAAKANVVVNGAKSTIANLAVNDEVMVNGLAKDSTTTQITANHIVKGTTKIDLSTLKNLKEKEGKGFGMGMGRGMGMGGFEPQEQAETTQQ